MSSPNVGVARTGPREPLSRDRVVAAAIAVMDDEGLSGLSMRRVASELNTGAMSLYRHVESREELLDLVLDAHAGGIALPEPSADWRVDVADLARAIRVVLLERRDLTLLMTARLGRGRAALPILDRAIGIFLRAGFPPPDAVRANHALGMYVSGAAVWEAVGLDGVADPAARAERGAESAARLAALPPGELPNLGATAAELFGGSSDERFEYGLALLIDGLDVRLEAIRASASREPSPAAPGVA